MKIFKLLPEILFSTMLAFNSCNEPETLVTNIIHPDGSVTRIIEIKSKGSNTDFSKAQVPYDSTWKITDTLEIKESGDTVKIRRAEKLFRNKDEINRYYSTDSTINHDALRRVEFSRKFEWFSTRYRFAEIVEKSMPAGYPLSSYLNEEELKWFYLPGKVQSDLINGPDSLKYKTVADSVESKTQLWLNRSIISQWISYFSTFAGSSSLKEEYLREKEDTLLEIFSENISNFDSLWAEGVILKKMIGEQKALQYMSEADSALKLIQDILFQNFSNYSVRITMPGSLSGTNGFTDSNSVPLWEVKREYFLTEPYVMWAESTTANSWAWIATAAILLLILARVVKWPFGKRKKGL